MRSLRILLRSSKRCGMNFHIRFDIVDMGAFGACTALEGIFSAMEES